jgi:signal transduction histidine kinase
MLRLLQPEALQPAAVAISFSQGCYSMSEAQLLAGLSLKAAADSVTLSDVDFDKVEKVLGFGAEKLTERDCWLTLETWRRAADYIESKSGSEGDLFFKAGKSCRSSALLGALEFFPWFLSSPALVIRNVEVITSHLDRILQPTIDHLTEQRCRISFLSRSDIRAPRRYFRFLQGYIISTLELWGSKIQNCHDEYLDGGKRLVFSLEWQQHDLEYRRVSEELLSDPDFFEELFESLSRFHSRKSERFSELIAINRELRGLLTESPAEVAAVEDEGQTPTVRLRSLLTSMYDGVLRLNRDGTIAGANHVAFTLLGFDSEKELLKACPSIWRLLEAHAIDADPSPKRVADLCDRIIEISLKRRDGTHAEFLLHGPAYPPDELGDQEIELILRESSEAGFSQELVRTRQFLEAIFYNNPAGLQILDTEGWTVKANPQLIKMFRLDTNKLMGVGKYNILQDPVMVANGLASSLKKALKGDQVLIPSLRLIDYRGEGSPFCANLSSPIAVQVNTYPLRNQLGDVFNVVVSYTDITESYLVEQQLAQIDKLQSIGTLTSGIAHDFNNLLGAIVPNADLIVTMTDESDFINRKAKVIKTAAKRAASLTQQLVSFARESQGDRKPLEINQSVQEAVELIGNAVPKNVSIDFEPGPDLPAVMADPLHMQQVLINLIINASDANYRGGVITIRTEQMEQRERTTFGGNIIPPGQYIKVSVGDEGPGIPPELVERVFDPFFTTKEKGQGTGLGLSVVYGIVKNHKGFITIDTTPGKGSTFSVHLPLVADESR